MSTLTISIVDDDDAYRAVLSRQLSMYNCFKIDYSSNKSSEALSNILFHNSHFAIIDIVMPVINGIQLTKELRVHGYKGKILALTSIENDYYFEELYSYGANHCMVKNNLNNVGEVLLKLTMSKQKILKDVIKLSDTEMKIIIEICNDKTNQQIADKLNLSKRTVETYRQKTAEKLNIQNSSVSFVKYAVKNGYYSLTA